MGLSRPRTRLRAKEALDHVASYPTEPVKLAVIARVRKVDSLFIQASMVMLEVFGGVEDAFAERPLLFQVQEQGKDGALLEQFIGRVTGRFPGCATGVD